MKICEVCKSPVGAAVLDLGSHPLCDDLKPIGSEEMSSEYPIEISFCETCFTAHQDYQPPKQELFSPDYHYRARMTGSVLSGMKDLVDSCEKYWGNLNGKKIIDIGCNDGSLLNFFRDKGCKTLGIEPTDAAKDSSHQTINAFFDEESAKQSLNLFGHPDVITFTNVFAHIEDLPQLLLNLKLLMSEETCLVIENHYLGAVLGYAQFDTFYHEHPRTYSAKSFEYIAKSLDCIVSQVQFVSRYGGNIRVFIQKNGNKIEMPDESAFPKRIKDLQKHADHWCEHTRKQIDDLVHEFGPLRAKAFPGRAAILIKMLGLTTSQISAVYEIKGSIKVQHYVPGTKIPILPEKELYQAEESDAPILNLAWHIPEEVRANLKKNGYTNDVIDIKEFKLLS